MKKYFLDPKYRKFTLRLTFGISLAATFLGFIVGGVAYGNSESALLFVLIPAPAVWLSYGCIVWILKALPNNDKD